jgi:hypothetical protein
LIITWSEMWNGSGSSIGCSWNSVLTIVYFVSIPIWNTPSCLPFTVPFERSFNIGLSVSQWESYVEAPPRAQLYNGSAMKMPMMPGNILFISIPLLRSLTPGSSRNY